MPLLANIGESLNASNIILNIHTELTIKQCGW